MGWEGGSGVREVGWEGGEGGGREGVRKYKMKICGIQMKT